MAQVHDAEHPLHADDRLLSHQHELLAHVDDLEGPGSVYGDVDLDAHRQVLGMAETIALLTEDFARQKEELAAAYKRLQQYALRDASTSDEDQTTQPSVLSQHRQCPHGDDAEDVCSCGCKHEAELQELRRLLKVKDVALAEALQQRNEQRVALEKAEVLIRELRALHIDSAGGRVPRNAWKVYPPPTPGLETAGWKSHSRAAPTASATHYSASTASSRTLLTTAATAALLGCAGAMEVPRGERFDVESSYQQRQETNDVFWRKQYKEAVRMRKTPASQNHSLSQYAVVAHNNAVGTAQPSLRIFSSPDNRRKKREQLRDESVPSSRYIGISSRQNAIIQEQHRMLS